MKNKTMPVCSPIYSLSSVEKHQIFENLTKDLYSEDSYFLIKYFSEEITEDMYYFRDNYRCYQIGDMNAEKQYNTKIRQGCCKFFDKKIMHPKSKKEYWVGFNYGHK